jgi:hypothetical protein
MLDEMGFVSLQCASRPCLGKASFAASPQRWFLFAAETWQELIDLEKSLMDDMTTEMTTRRHSPPYCNSSCSQLISFLLRGVAFLSRCFPFGGSPAVLSDGIQKDGGRKTNCANIVS